MIAPDIHTLEVSNLGTAVSGYLSADNIYNQWSVPVPALLLNRGSCTITVTAAHLRFHHFPDLWKEIGGIFVETNIPIQGYDTSSSSTTVMSSQMTKLFDIAPVEYETVKGFRSAHMLNPWTFRCPGGLPSHIEMRAMTRGKYTRFRTGQVTLPGLLESNRPHNLMNRLKAYEDVDDPHYDAHIVFRLAIQFDSSLYSN
jgi:hypothetical protein